MVIIRPRETDPAAATNGTVQEVASSTHAMDGGMKTTMEEDQDQEEVQSQMREQLREGGLKGLPTDEEAALQEKGLELKKAAERNPRDFYAQTAYARWQADIVGNARVAVFYFNKALKLVEVDKEPEMRDSYVYTIGCLAEALESMKLYDKAEQSYKAALHCKPDDAQCLGSYALFLHRIRKDYGAAEAMYKRAVSLHDTHASVLTKYANFLKSVTGNLIEAERYYRMAVEASPENADCLGSYAVFLHGQRKDDEKTATYYRRALEADPSHVNILSNYGLFLAEVQNDYTGAKVVYERALALDPQHSNCLYNYAVLYDSSLRVPERAEQLYRKALQFNPRHAYALYNLAILLEEKAAEQGDLSQVRSLFEKAVAIAPGDAMTLADYGRFVFVRERNHKLAEELLERALAADPDYAPALFYLGMLLLNVKNKAAEAEKHFRRCLANNLAHSGANQYLARILAQDKRKRYTASEYYQKAMETSPSSVELLLEFSRYLSDSRKPADKERAKELYRKACELSQNGSRIGKTSRVGNTHHHHHLNRPWAPSGNTSTNPSSADLRSSSHSKVNPHRTSSIIANTLQAAAPSASSSSSAAIEGKKDDNKEEDDGSQLWMDSKPQEEVNRHRRTRTLVVGGPSLTRGGDGGVIMESSSHKNESMEGSSEDGGRHVEAPALPWSIRRRRRVVSLPSVNSFVGLTFPEQHTAANGDDGGVKSDGPAPREPKQEQEDREQQQPQQQQNGQTVSLTKEGGARVPRMWETLPSRGDGVTGWGDDGHPTSPEVGGTKGRRRGGGGGSSTMGVLPDLEDTGA